MTLSEYFQTPETTLPRELIDGVLRVADAPFVSHQRVVLRLAMAMQQHVERTGNGEVLVAPVDVVLDPDRPLVVQPDLLYVSTERSSIVDDRVYGAPDLVIEVLSPRPRIGDLNERVEWFATYGVREIWLYDQLKRALDILECDGGAVREASTFGEPAQIASGVLPGFAPSMLSLLGYR